MEFHWDLPKELSCLLLDLCSNHFFNNFGLSLSSESFSPINIFLSTNSEKVIHLLPTPHIFFCFSVLFFLFSFLMQITLQKPIHCCSDSLGRLMQVLEEEEEGYPTNISLVFQLKDDGNCAWLFAKQAFSLFRKC